MGMVCLLGINFDDFFLYVLCCNDICSFIWIGVEYIN